MINNIKLKHYVMIISASLLALFILQNMTMVEIRFLFWHISISRPLVLIALLSIGIVIGWLLHSYYLSHKNSHS